MIESSKIGIIFVIKFQLNCFLIALASFEIPFNSVSRLDQSKNDVHGGQLAVGKPRLLGRCLHSFQLRQTNMLSKCELTFMHEANAR